MTLSSSFSCKGVNSNADGGVFNFLNSFMERLIHQMVNEKIPYIRIRQKKTDKMGKVKWSNRLNKLFVTYKILYLMNDKFFLPRCRGRFTRIRLVRPTQGKGPIRNLFRHTSTGGGHTILLCRCTKPEMAQSFQRYVSNQGLPCAKHVSPHRRKQAPNKDRA